MFHPRAPVLAFLSVLMAGAVFADEAGQQPAPSNDATEQPAVATVAPDPASAPQAATAAAAPTEIPYPADRLPVAEPPGFFKLHPLTMPKISMPKPDFAKFKPGSGFAGVGVFNDMINLNGTLLTPNGVFYARAGRFMANNQGAAFNAGWRHPLTAGINEDGYQLGIFAGQVIGDGLNGKKINRMGAGVDVSYQWITPNTLRVFSVGLGAGESKTSGGARLRSKPTPFFSYSISLKIF